MAQRCDLTIAVFSPLICVDLLDLGGILSIVCIGTVVQSSHRLELGLELELADALGVGWVSADEEIGTWLWSFGLSCFERLPALDERALVLALSLEGLQLLRELRHDSRLEQALMRFAVCLLLSQQHPEIVFWAGLRRYLLHLVDWDHLGRENRVADEHEVGLALWHDVGLED